MHLGALPPAFAGLEPEDSREAAACLQPFSLEAGEVLMEQGDDDATLVFVVQGSLSLMDGDTRIGGATSRDMLGEIELFGHMARSASVVATVPTHLLVLGHEQWLELCERGNPAVYNIERQSHRRMGDRLRQLAEGIAERSNGSRPFPQGERKGLMGRLSGLLGARAPMIDPSAVLQHSTLFNWADPDVLAEIASGMGAERFGAGAIACRKGDIGERAWIVVDGQADLVVNARHEAETIAQVGPGQAFGDAMFAQHAPHFASWVCATDLIAVTLQRDRYGELFGANDPAGSVFRQSMLKNLVQQLVAAQARFVELDRRASATVEASIRGTPVSTVWRD